MRTIRSCAWLVSVLVVSACASHVDGSGGDGASSGASSGASGSNGDPGSSSGGPGSSSGYEGDPNNGGTRPPPVITEVSPLAGDYGTVVTVTGDNLDEASAQLVLDGPGDPVKLSKPPAGAPPGSAGDVIVKWSKTEIQFRYPFPADGAVRISTRSGQANGGTFVPSYAPGVPLSGTFTRRELLGVVSPAAGTMTAVFDGKTGPQILTVRPDGSIATNAYNRGAKALQRMSVYATPGGHVEGFYMSGGTLYQLTDAAGSPATASTGVTGLDAAGGYDGTGAYAWVRKSGAQIVRVRAPSWTTSETVTDPIPSGAPGPSMGVALDDSLFVGWGINDDGFFPTYDHTAHPAIRRLRAGQTTFDGKREFGSGADDEMVWTRLLPGPDGRVYSYYCANDTGYMADPETDCGEGYAGAGTDRPSEITIPDYFVGYGETTSYAAACVKKTNTLTFGPEDQTAQQEPILFPCPKILAAAVDGAGKGMLLVTVGDHVYAPRPR